MPAGAAAPRPALGGCLKGAQTLRARSVRPRASCTGCSPAAARRGRPWRGRPPRGRAAAPPRPPRAAPPRAGPARWPPGAAAARPRTGCATNAVPAARRAAPAWPARRATRAQARRLGTPPEALVETPLAPMAAPWYPRASPARAARSSARQHTERSPQFPQAGPLAVVLQARAGLAGLGRPRDAGRAGELLVSGRPSASGFGAPSASGMQGFGSSARLAARL